MATASFAVTPATLDDVPAIVDAFFHGFASERTDHLLPPTPDTRAWLEETYAAFVRSEAGRQQSRVFVLRDENGKTAGFALYWIVDPKDGGFRRWEERHPALVASLSRERLDGFFTQKENNHNKVMGQEGHIFLETMTVHKSIRGRGLAAKLLEAGRELADSLDYPAYLNATKLAVTLYERAGYVVQDTGLPCISTPMRMPKKSEREAKP